MGLRLVSFASKFGVEFSMLFLSKFVAFRAELDSLDVAVV